ncbi:MAG: adenosine deaminase [Myxococcales bacterium]|nr:adenosine deaminase [Myxococcales bacterium]MCB9645487.1 adenosine deaminase [Deltaproteobacteria bacterium]
MEPAGGRDQAQPDGSGEAVGSGAPPVTLELLRALPKTDLHCHLDGSLRLRTILELAEQDRVPLGATDEDALARRLHLGENCESLEAYLEAFEVTLSVMQTEGALYRTAYELAADAAAENVRYMEVRYSPILHTQRGLPLPNIVEAVVQGLRDAERDHKIRSGVILCGIRNMDPLMSFRMAELAVAFKHAGVVGFDLAGAEVDYPAKNHVEAFRLILNNNVNCTLHAGEAYGPESIHQAIHYCGAHRVGHGVRLAEDGDLLNYVNDHRIALEVCPSSNVQTGAVRSLETHPMRFYFDYGIRLTINTDNRLITDTTSSKELWLAHQHMGFSLEELMQVIMMGFKSAFLPLRERRALLLEAARELEALTAVSVRPEIADRDEEGAPHLARLSERPGCA